MNYYNENDPKTAAWLRELIKEGYIAPGDVDTRSIVDVKPHELTRYTQQHFFAGIGGWSLALRLSGWPDDQPVRTGSCPCQPFSCSGKQLGTKDPRHLWPHFRDLITFGQPAITFGEQVASPLGREWLAGVRDDLEGLGYEVGAADLCAAGVGAPHIRQRLYWMANPGRISHERRLRSRKASGPPGQDEGEARKREWRRNDAGVCGCVGGLELHASDGREQRRAESGGRGAESRCGIGGVDNATGARLAQEGKRTDLREERSGERVLGDGGNALRVAHSGHEARRTELGKSLQECGSGIGQSSEGMSVWMGNPDGPGRQVRTRNGGNDGETNKSPRGKTTEQNGSWSNFLIAHCSDGKARRFEPGSFPLAHGVPHRVGLLRGYGNAIVAPLAAEFIMAAVESIEGVK